MKLEKKSKSKKPNSPQSASKPGKNSFTYAILALTLALAARLLPMLKGPISTFGYDYGFYFDAAKNARNVNWQDLLTAFWGGFNNPLFYLFSLLHVPPELSLTLSYLIFTLLLGLSLYWLFLSRDKTAAVFALVLYSFSTVQMESYLMFLYKNAFALPFMILGFKFTKERRWWPLAFSSAVIILTHRTTAIIYFLTIGLYFIWLIIKNKNWKLLALLSAFGFLLLITSYYFLNLKPLILNLISNNNFYVRTGLFLPLDSPLKLVWPYLLFAVPGFIIYIKRRQNPLLIFFTGVCLLWLFFHLPFYRRVWIYFDLSLIIFSAYFLSSLLSWRLSDEALLARRSFSGGGVKLGTEGRVRPNFSKFFSASIIIIFLFTGFRFTSFTLAKEPLIRPREIQEIKTFNPLFSSSPLPVRRPVRRSFSEVGSFSGGGRGEDQGGGGGFILALSANDAPWLLAYADGYRLGAPGLLEDPHTYEQWLAFWQGLNQRDFISQYPRPLYFYQRTYRLPPSIFTSCLRPLSQNFSEVDYVCLEN